MHDTHAAGMYRNDSTGRPLSLRTLHELTQGYSSTIPLVYYETSIAKRHEVLRLMGLGYLASLASGVSMAQQVHNCAGIWGGCLPLLCVKVVSSYVNKR